MFKKPPDASWPQVPTVTRQAYSSASTTVATAALHASSTPQVALYLRRGRPGRQVLRPAERRDSPVAGQRTIEGIVGVFASSSPSCPPRSAKGP